MRERIQGWSSGRGRRDPLHPPRSDASPEEEEEAMRDLEEVEEKKRMASAAEELERRSRYLSSLIQRTKLKEEEEEEVKEEETKEKRGEEGGGGGGGGEGGGGGGETQEEKYKVRIRASDMPPALQKRAFRCARETLAAMAKLDSKRLALALKKEFDSSYGPAWHCIVGTSFGSYVTHSLGGFLYFSIDKVYILLFRTAVEPLTHRQ
ncbi:uncharacterized protein [Typha angustifolia]|uniref:uncharacterized protein n=1 Tax=Typha angustifolia TaxID=59011 RepID=UPI003C2D18E2